MTARPARFSPVLAQRPHTLFRRMSLMCDAKLEHIVNDRPIVDLEHWVLVTDISSIQRLKIANITRRTKSIAPTSRHYTTSLPSRLQTCTFTGYGFPFWSDSEPALYLASPAQTSLPACAHIPPNKSGALPDPVAVLLTTLLPYPSTYSPLTLALCADTTMSTRTSKQPPVRYSPYPKRERTKSNKTVPTPAGSTPASPKHKPSKLPKQKKAEAPPVPPPVLRSPLFNGVNPAYLTRAMRAVARGNYPDAHGFLHLCIQQARHAASAHGGASSLVVCLLMLYSDNWLRLGVPSRAVISMEDALIAQEAMGEETDEERREATLAGLELREYMHTGKPK